MSDLETTAHEAVARVQPMVEALDEAQHECQEAIRYVHALHDRLAADHRALQAAVAALQQDAEQAEQTLATLAGAAATSVEHLGEAAAAAASDWEARLGKEDEALAGGAQLVTELGERVRELAAKADETRQQVLDWTASLSQHLEQTVEAVEQAISVDLVAAVADWRRDAEASVQRLVDFLEKDCEELLAGKEADWKEKLPQALELLDHACSGIAPHQQEVGAYVIERWGQHLEAQLDRAQTQVHGLDEQISSLRQATENVGGQVRLATEMVGELQQKAADDAVKLAQGFAAARARWAAMGITH